jgi:UrcA family protein
MKTMLMALASLSLAAASPAFAADEPAKVAVRYNDLDLSSPEGRGELEKRIQAAARAVCGMTDSPTTGSRITSRSRLDCYAQATSQIGASVARAIERRQAAG